MWHNVEQVARFFSRTIRRLEILLKRPLKRGSRIRKGSSLRLDSFAFLFSLTLLTIIYTGSPREKFSFGENVLGEHIKKSPTLAGSRAKWAITHLLVWPYLGKMSDALDSNIQKIFN